MTDPRNQRVYFSVDTEFDGPSPLYNSLMSIGVVAYSHDGREIGRFSANLKPLPGRKTHPRTDAFWAKHPEAYQATQINQRDPVEVMKELHEWIRSEQFMGKRTMIAWPLKTDGEWLDCYFDLVTDPNEPLMPLVDPFAKRIDIGEVLKSAADMPEYMGTELPYTHISIEDAAHQGAIYMKFLALQRQHEANRKKPDSRAV